MVRQRTLLLTVLLVSACDCGDTGLVSRSGLAQLTPEIVDFGDVVLSTTQLRVLDLENVGDHVVIVDDQYVAGPEVFFIVQRAPERMESGAKSTIGVEFAPTQLGPFEGTLELLTDDAIGSHTAILRGRGVPAPGVCTLSVAPSPIQYPSVQVGENAEMTAILTNIAAVDCAITRLEITGLGAPDFTLLDANPQTVAAGASVPIRIRFARSMPNERTALLDVASDDPNNPLHQVPLLTGGTRAGLCVMPTSIHFGATTGTDRRDVTITACGDRDVTIEALDFTTANPEIGIAAVSLPFTLRMGEQQVVTVEYTPTDQVDDRAILTVRSDDPLVPTVDVEITGSADVVPEESGRFLYFWSITDNLGESNIMQVALQGGGAASPYWGQTNGESGCPGCHQVSPDGRYLAVIELNVVLMTTYIVDTRTKTQIQVPLQLRTGSSFSWRPDVNANPPYQYAVGVRGDVRLGSVTGGFLGDLPGAADPNIDEAMPSWGPDGEIVFVRGTFDSQFSGFGFVGTSDLVVVPEGGGTAVPLAGASQNQMANYYPAYSPSGRWISFTQSAGGGSYASADAKVRLVAPDQSGMVAALPTINGATGATSFPTWSIDGRFLSISSNRGGGSGNWDIYIAPIDEAAGMATGAPTNLTSNTPGFEHDAVWSP